jgi:hypothetical protein
LQQKTALGLYRSTRGASSIACSRYHDGQATTCPASSDENPATRWFDRASSFGPERITVCPGSGRVGIRWISNCAAHTPPE